MMQRYQDSSHVQSLHAEEVQEHNKSSRVVNGTKMADPVEVLTPIITSSTGRRFRTLDDELDDDVDHYVENRNGNNISKGSVNGLDKPIGKHKDNSISNNTSICYDSYGFRVTAREKAAEQVYDNLINGMNCSSSASNTNNTNGDKKVVSSCLSSSMKERKRYEKWMTRLENWNTVSAAEKKKMCRSGIPRTIRREAWRKILGMPNANTNVVNNKEHTNHLAANSATTDTELTNDLHNENNHSSSSYTDISNNHITISREGREKETGVLTIMSYRELYSANLSSRELSDVIERDLNRTFPTHRWFNTANGKGQCMLRRLLHAYANRNPDVGYCQGMGFVVSTMLVLFEDEESAFWAFCALMEEPMYNLQMMYFPGFEELKCKFCVMEKLLKRLQPKVYHRIRAADVDPSLYATHWFLTLFSYNLNFALLLRIWDMFLCEGWKPIYRVALSFFFLERNHIAAMRDDSRLVKLLMSMHERAYPSELLEAAQHIKFKTSIVKVYERNYHKKVRKKRKKKNV